MIAKTLADKAGVAQPFLSQIETGKREGTIETLKNWPKRLGSRSMTSSDTFAFWLSASRTVFSDTETQHVDLCEKFRLILRHPTAAEAGGGALAIMAPA